MQRRPHRQRRLRKLRRRSLRKPPNSRRRGRTCQNLPTCRRLLHQSLQRRQRRQRWQRWRKKHLTQRRMRLRWHSESRKQNALTLTSRRRKGRKRRQVRRQWRLLVQRSGWQHRHRQCPSRAMVFAKTRLGDALRTHPAPQPSAPVLPTRAVVTQEASRRCACWSSRRRPRTLAQRGAVGHCQRQPQGLCLMLQLNTQPTCTATCRILA